MSKINMTAKQRMEKDGIGRREAVRRNREDRQAIDRKMRMDDDRNRGGVALCGPNGGRSGGQGFN